MLLELLDRLIESDLVLAMTTLTAVTLAILFVLATRNLREMSARIREHNQTSLENFARVQEALREIEVTLARFR